MNWDEVSIAYGVFFWVGKGEGEGGGDEKKAMK